MYDELFVFCFKARHGGEQVGVVLFLQVLEGEIVVPVSPMYIIKYIFMNCTRHVNVMRKKDYFKFSDDFFYKSI